MTVEVAADRRHDARAWSRSPTATATRSTAPGCEHAAKVAGVSINDLTDPERLDVSGNAALSGVPVTVAAAG